MGWGNVRKEHTPLGKPKYLSRSTGVRRGNSLETNHVRFKPPLAKPPQRLCDHFKVLLKHNILHLAPGESYVREQTISNKTVSHLVVCARRTPTAPRTPSLSIYIYISIYGLLSKYGFPYWQDTQ